MAYLADVVEVGGNGGSPFEFNANENGATLKKIWVWIGDCQVKAMQFWLTDGQSRQFGKPAGNVAEFIFKDGEHFSSLSLWPNGAGTRLGAIKFKTNHSREFHAWLTKGVLKPEVLVDVASGICMGIKGRSGSDIDRLGFTFLHSIKSTELTDVEYPTLLTVKPKVAVRELKSMTYQNNTSETQEYTMETSKTITQTSSWSVTGNLEITVSSTVNAGTPLLVEGKAGFGLKLGVEGTYSSETTAERMERLSFLVKVPPGKTVHADITIGEATIHLPFNGKVKIICDNGGELEFETNGTYKGITYTGGNVVVNESTKKLGGASGDLK